MSSRRLNAVRDDPVSQSWRFLMSHLHNVHRKVCVIAALHLIAGAVISGSAATSSAQETARPSTLGSAASHASSSPIMSNDGPVPLRLAQAQVGRPMQKITFLLDFTPYGKDRKSTRLNSSHLGI